MIHEIALTTILGVPIVAHGGMLTFLSFSFTAFIGYTNHKHFEYHLPFIWHPSMVIVSFTFAIIHIFFASSILIGY